MTSVTFTVVLNDSVAPTRVVFNSPAALLVVLALSAFYAYLQPLQLKEWLSTKQPQADENRIGAPTRSIPGKGGVVATSSPAADLDPGLGAKAPVAHWPVALAISVICVRPRRASCRRSAPACGCPGVGRASPGRQQRRRPRPPRLPPWAGTRCDLAPALWRSVARVGRLSVRPGRRASPSGSPAPDAKAPRSVPWSIS